MDNSPATPRGVIDSEEITLECTLDHMSKDSHGTLITYKESNVLCRQPGQFNRASNEYTTQRVTAQFP